MTRADRVGVMNGGLIDQVGSPNELYHNPRTKFVAGFIGSPSMNFVPCRLDQASGALNILLPDGTTFAVPDERTARYRDHAGRDDLLLGLRPEHITETHRNVEPNQDRKSTRLNSSH